MKPGFPRAPGGGNEIVGYRVFSLAIESSVYQESDTGLCVFK